MGGENSETGALHLQPEKGWLSRIKRKFSKPAGRRAQPPQTPQSPQTSSPEISVVPEQKENLDAQLRKPVDSFAALQERYKIVGRVLLAMHLSHWFDIRNEEGNIDISHGKMTTVEHDPGRLAAVLAHLHTRDNNPHKPGTFFLNHQRGRIAITPSEQELGAQLYLDYRDKMLEQYRQSPMLGNLKGVEIAHPELDNMDYVLDDAVPYLFVAEDFTSPDDLKLYIRKTREDMGNAINPITRIRHYNHHLAETGGRYLSICAR